MTNPTTNSADEPERPDAASESAMESQSTSPPPAQPNEQPEQILSEEPAATGASPEADSQAMPVAESAGTAEASATEPVDFASNGHPEPGEAEASGTEPSTTEFAPEPPAAEAPTEPVPLDETAPFQPVAEESATPSDLPPPAAESPTAPPSAFSSPPHHHVGRHEAAHDRVWPHFLWELLLAIGVAALVLIYWAQESPGFEFDHDVKPLFFVAAVVATLAVGFSFSLRVGVPNLAVFPIATASSALAALGAREHDWSEWACITVAIATAALVGLILGVVIVVLHVPGWVATFGASFAILAWTVNVVKSDPRLAEVVRDGPDLSDWWGVFFAGAVLVSVIGGLVWTIPGVRSAWTVRPSTDPAARPSAVAALSVLAAMTVSSAVAALAGGFLWLNYKPTPASGPGLFADEVQANINLVGMFNSLITFTVMVLAAVLLGGTSAFGRRGGVFGTMLAVVGLVLLHEVADVSLATFWYIAAGAVGVGLVATRILESVGKQSAPDREQSLSIR